MAALKASSRLGRAYRLRDRGKTQDALIAAREGLAILSRPFVRRLNAAEGSALACLTTLSVELASELGLPGPTMRDVKDSLEFINQLSGNTSAEVQVKKALLSYLEAKADE